MARSRISRWFDRLFARPDVRAPRAVPAPSDDPYERLQAIAAAARARPRPSSWREVVWPTQPTRTPAVERSRVPQVERSWSEVETVGLRLEADRDFEQALFLYREVRRDDLVALDLAIGRCCIQLGQVGAAVHHAERALAADPHGEAALAIHTKACYLAKQFAPALSTADRWIAVYPGAGAAHYARGRCLFALGRLLDARESFERACALAPELLEAQLLRREVDRCLGSTRATVGTQPSIELDLPEHLAELRAVLVDGTLDGAIRLLARPAYATDPVARLLLAGCLSFDRRHAEALAIYEQVAEQSHEHRHEASLGQARALVELGRASEALAIVDRACCERPSDLDASEGRAQALRRLGREGEAELEARRLASVIGDRSALRVRLVRLGFAT